MGINRNKVMEAAQKYVAKGALDKAIREYLKVVNDDPKDVRVWLKIGDLYAKKGAKQEATETYFKVARFYAEQGFYLKAIAVYKQILKIDPRLVDVNKRLAELYRQLGLLSDAMQQYELVAAFYHREGKTREALQTIRELADLDPDNVATRIKLAELYSKEGMTDEAVAEFTKAADYLRDQNRFDDFIKVAERLVWHKPDDLAVNKELATLYLERKDARRALQKLQVCFKADPRDVATLELLAQAFQILGQSHKSVSVWKELARIHKESNRHEEANDVYRRILDVAPDDADARAALGVNAVTPEPAADVPPPEPAAGQAFPRVATPISGVELPQVPVDALSTEPPRYPGRQPTGSIPLVKDPFAPKGPARLEMDEPAPESEDVDLEMDVEPSLPTGEEVVMEQGADTAEAHADEIAKVLTETDVYMKYGLHQKAVEHIRKIFDIDPHNVEGHDKLKEIYLAMGRTSEAVAELVLLVELVAPSNPDAAAAYLIEVADLDPQNIRARELAVQFGLPMPQGAPADDDVPDLEEDLEIEPDEISLATGELSMEPDDVSVEIEAEDSLVEASNPILDVELAEPAGDLEFEFEDLGSAADLDSMPTGGGTVDLESPEELGLEVDPGTTAEGPRYTEPELEPPSMFEGTGAGAGTSLEDDLDEADFFISQNLFQEARSILEDLLGRYPNHPLILAKLQDLDAMQAAPTAVEEVPPPPLREGPTPLPMEEPTAEPEAQQKTRESKRPSVIAKPLGEADADTHFDLGLAYKEMGLIDEAIKEFQLVMDTPGRAVQCQKMIGLCYTERGDFSEGISQFKKGLYIEGITERESLDLYFEIGAAYEALDDPKEALYYYEKVAKRDPRFRDVSSRVEALKKGGGGKEDPPDTVDEVEGAIDSLLE